MWFYSLSMVVYAALIRIASLFHKKAQQWVEGRDGMFEQMKKEMDGVDNIAWVHVASLGDFEQGRPIVDYIHDNYPEYKVLLTFFSPSGYEVRKNYEKADYVFYIPVDTKRNVRRFLDIANPKIAIFVKYEFWLNMLAELRSRGIRTFIASAIFRRNSIFFLPFGGLWRKGLRAFERLFVQDDHSKELLAGIGVTNVEVAGDTRFDRVASIAQKAEKVGIIEAFKGEKRLFVAGSTWGADEEILLPLINANPDIKFVIAPHEISENRIKHIERMVSGGMVRFSQSEGVDFADKQVFVLDTMGLLSRAYGSAEWAYIGGGFGVGIHNTLEAAVFGLPVAFGPKYRKFKEACDLIAIGVAHSVKDGKALEDWFSSVRDNDECLAKIRTTAEQYTAHHIGATERILKSIF